MMSKKSNSYIKPFSMSRFVTFWHCECEFEVDGNVVTMFEPLHYDADLDKTWKPVWEYDRIRFYHVDHKPQVYVNRHLMFTKGSSPDVLILQNGLCVEVTTGQVIWRGDRWFVSWKGYTHTRSALMAKQGFKAWKL